MGEEVDLAGFDGDHGGAGRAVVDEGDFAENFAGNQGGDVLRLSPRPFFDQHPP